MLIIAFDYGTKNIGVAIGQKITGTATTVLDTIKVINGIPNWQKIKKILQEWNPYIAIIGLPLNMNGTEQKISIMARKFANKLNKKYKIKIEMHDERLTTMEAKNKLFLIGGIRYLNKKKIDSTSASFILESWMRLNN